MHVRSVSLRGFIGTSRGLGLDQVDLDLSNLRGVVALVGTNGSSKTTLLENLQPWRWLPSRGINLKDAVQLRNSHKDVTFDMNGHVVRTLVTIDAHTGDSDGNVWVDDQSKTKSGKVTQVDEVLESLLGSQDLFFQSVFAAQATESFLNLKPAKRKDFFVEILGLSRLQSYSERAKTVANYIAGRMDSLRQSATKLEQETARLQEYESLHAATVAHLAGLEPKLDKLRKDLEEAQIELQRMELQQGDVAGIRQRIEELRKQRSAIVSEYDSRIKTLRSRIASGKGRMQTLQAEIASKEKILSQVDQSAPTAEEIGQMEHALSDVEQAIEEQNAIQLQILEIGQRHRAAIQHFEQTLTKAKEIAGLVIKIPSAADQAICGKCGFAQLAIQSKTEYPQIEAALEERRRSLETDLAPLRARVNGDLITKRNQIRADLTASRASHQRFLQAESIRESVRFALLQTKHEATQIAEADSELNATFQVSQAKTADIDQQIETESIKLTVSDLSSGLMKQRALVAGKSDVLRFATNEADKERVAIGVFEDKITRCRQALSELSSVRDKLKMADAQRAEWVTLQQICGRDKLQALELDIAAPAITSLATHLLSECFGGRFSCQFITMDPDGKEVFDLQVTDNKANRTESVLLKCGGEKVIVLHALRLAITIYDKEQSGRDFRTIFLDEVDGALAPEVRSTFVEMNRAAMRSGGFDTMFMVTHSVEVRDAVDHVIEFKDGRIVVD